jgi:translation initiation factor 1
MAKKSKKRVDIVYSTNPDFQFQDLDDDEQQETLENNEQLLYVSIDRKNRGGKDVTLIEGFLGTPEDLKELGKTLKSKCGVGGGAKDGEILIQGNFRDKVIGELEKLKFRVKRKGG